MNKTYAVIFNDIVENFTTSELPVEDIEKLPGRQLVEIPSDHEMGYGYRYDGTNFTAPSTIQVKEQDISQLLVSLINSLDDNQKNSLLQILSGNTLSSNETPLPQTTL